MTTMALWQLTRAHDVGFVVITGTAHYFHDCIYIYIYIYIYVCISAHFNENQINQHIWTTLHRVFKYSMLV